MSCIRHIVFMPQSFCNNSWIFLRKGSAIPLYFYVLCSISAVFVVGPARPRTLHDCHHDTKVKPEAATAVIELLMMGGKTPETCWAVNKRQDNNWKTVASGWWFIWIVQWCKDLQTLTFILLMRRIWWAPNNASKWQMGFNSAFKGLNFTFKF